MHATATPDAERIRHDLTRLTTQTREISALANRDIHLPQEGTPMHTQATSAPTPINLTAMDLLNQITALARFLCHAARLHPTRSMGPISLLTGTTQPTACQRLANRPDAWTITRLIAEASESCERLLDPAPATMLAGNCPWCAAGIWLPDKPESRTLAWHRCDSCGRSVDLAVVRQAQRMRLLASGYVGTAAQLASLLCRCGYRAKRNTITQWHKRGKLPRVGANEAGAPLFTLGSVLTLIGEGVEAGRPI